MEIRESGLDPLSERWVVLVVGGDEGTDNRTALLLVLFVSEQQLGSVDLEDSLKLLVNENLRVWVFLGQKLLQLVKLVH